MKTLGEFASILRSKNAGPLYVTFDIMFEDEGSYEAVKTSGALSAENVGRAYGVAPEKVEIYIYDLVTSIKITIPRKTVCGALDDDDIYGCQQHIPLSNIPVK